MVTQRLWISTCGTSVLTFEADQEMRNFLARTANAKEGDLSKEDRLRIDDRALSQEEALRAGGVEAARSMSAELNAIVAYHDGVMRQTGAPDHHILLHTDTYQGQLAAEILADWLSSNRCTTELWPISGLQTGDLKSFKKAMDDVARRVREEVLSWREQRYHVVFNLTGGFKSVAGFLQTLGMVYADECVYLFEAPSSPLLRIPRLPLSITPEAAVTANPETFRRLFAGYCVEQVDCVGIPETLLDVDEGQATLSSFGQMAFDAAKRKVYGGGLLEPLSDRLVYGPRFREQAGRLDSTHLLQLNEKLDRLSFCLDSGREQCLRSLRFHQLAGNPVPPSTHEFYPFHGNDSRRAFGHFEDERFVVDALGQHL